MIITENMLGPDTAIGAKDAIDFLNEKVAYVRDPQTMVELETKKLFTPADFKNHRYANLFYLGADSKGNPKVRPLAPLWLGSLNRHEYKRMVYAPGELTAPYAPEFNRWAGWGAEPIEGDVTLWTALLDFLFTGDPGARLYFEQWCAYPIQHPGAKMYSAVLLYSIVQGIGKSLLAEILSMIYGRNATSIKEENLDATFNEWAADRQFVFVEEICGGGAKKKELGEKLKTLITQERVTINKKFEPTYELADRANYLFLSNHIDALNIPDKDRRFFIHEVLQTSTLPKEFYDEFHEWKQSAGPSALHYHLLHQNLEGFDARGRVPVTAAKSDMIEQSRSPVEQFAIDLRDNRAKWLKLSNGQPDPGVLFTIEQLLNRFRGDPRYVTDKTLMRALRGVGFKSAAQIRTGGRDSEQIRPWIISAIDTENLAESSAAFVRKQYEEECNFRKNCLTCAPTESPTTENTGILAF